MACPVHMSRRARRLQLSVRSYDMVGRYGGGEFLVALNRCDPGSAISLAENLRTVIGGRPISVGNQKVTVTISIGLAPERNCVRVAAPGGGKRQNEQKTHEPSMLRN